MNKEIDVDEVLKCINKLKNGKACGQVLNEFIKYSKDVMCAV